MFITDPYAPLDYLDIDGLSYPEEDTNFSFEEVSFSFSLTGRQADKTARMLMGFPYVHLKQILHNGKKP